ncbi:MAG: hypothetical protein ABFC71_03650 [Methanoregula sp.]
MNKLVLLVMGLLFCTGNVSAYQVVIQAPDTLTVGEPLLVSGTTTFGIGTPIDVVLSYQLTTSTEVSRKIAYVMSDKTFRVVFDTTDLKKGVYKVEVPTNGMGDSVTMRLVNLVDRSDEIHLSSQTTQSFNGKLYVTGTLSTDASSGVQIEVIGPDGSHIFGPMYINTNYQGSFSADIPITQSGDYEVSFTDAQGYVGKRIITVISTDATIAPPTAATTAGVHSAHVKASRDNPAYFVVRPGTGSFKVYTSSSIDWVIEYVDTASVLHMINDHGELNPEEIMVKSNGKAVYFKIYPYKYSVTGEVFLYAENVNSVSVSPTVPAVFGTMSQIPAETPASPVSPVLCLFAAGIIGVLSHLRK